MNFDANRDAIRQPRLQSFLAESSEDLERICEAQSGEAGQSTVFVVENPDFTNSILAVHVHFLEFGQALGWRRLPLLGAVFDPDWGFSCMSVSSRPKDKAAFCLPPLDPRDLYYGNTHGYRFCTLEDVERASMELDLASIFRALDHHGQAGSSVPSV